MAAPDYNFELFAPERKPEKRQEPQLKKVERPRKSKSELVSERKNVILKILRTTVVTLFVSALASLNIYGYCQSDLADKQYKKLQEKVEMVQSENTRLSMELNKMVSLEQIETMAVEKFGFVKLNSGDIEYVKLADGNRVVVSSGKTVG